MLGGQRGVRPDTISRELFGVEVLKGANLVRLLFLKKPARRWHLLALQN